MPLIQRGARRRLCRPRLGLHSKPVFDYIFYQRNECAYEMADKYHLLQSRKAIRKYQWTFKKTLNPSLKVVLSVETRININRPRANMFIQSLLRMCTLIQHRKLKIITVVEVRYSRGYKYYPPVGVHPKGPLMYNQTLSSSFHLVSLKG